MRFKRHAKTGPYRSFQKTFVDIIDNGKVGQISETDKGDYKVSLIIKDSEQPCGWRWTSLIYRGSTEEVAREFVRSRWGDIRKRYDLHPLVD